MGNALVALVLILLGILFGGLVGLILFAAGIVFAALALRDLILR